MKLKVEIFEDTDTGQWCYDVPALSIIGTGCNSREDAEKFALEAIEFTLEEENDQPAESAEVITYEHPDRQSQLARRLDRRVDEGHLAT